MRTLVQDCAHSSTSQKGCVPESSELGAISPKMVPVNEHRNDQPPPSTGAHYSSLRSASISSVHVPLSSSQTCSAGTSYKYGHNRNPSSSSSSSSAFAYSPRRQPIRVGEESESGSFTHRTSAALRSPPLPMIPDGIPVMKTHRRKRSHHMPRPPTPPRRAAPLDGKHPALRLLSDKAASPSSSRETYDEGLASMTGAAEVALRRRTRSAPKTATFVEFPGANDALQGCHRRTTSLGGDLLGGGASYRRARSASKASQLSTDPSPPKPHYSAHKASASADQTLYGPTMARSSPPRRALPPPPIVVPVHPAGVHRRSKSHFIPPSQEARPPSLASNATPTSAQILTPLCSQPSPKQSTSGKAAGSPREALLHPLPRTSSLTNTARPMSPPFPRAEANLASPFPRFHGRTRAHTLSLIPDEETRTRVLSLSSTDEQAAPESSVETLAETLAAVREAAFWDWPMPPTRRPSATLLSGLGQLAIVAARHNAHTYPRGANAPLSDKETLDDDDTSIGYLPYLSRTPSQSVDHSSHGRVSDYEPDLHPRGESRQSGQSHDIGLLSSAQSSEIGPLTPDEDCPLECTPVLLKRVEKKHDFIDRELTPRAVGRPERFGIPF